MRSEQPRKLPILSIDPWLAPFEGDLNLRMDRYRDTRAALIGQHGALCDFANAHLYFGFHREGDGWVYREWAPGADALYLIGDFNGWRRDSHPLARLSGGAWELRLEGADALKHLQRVKVRVVSRAGDQDRIPLFIRRVVQNKEDHSFSGQLWSPEEKFHWTDGGFTPNEKPPLIYEAHVGMATECERVGTYREFTRDMLPRIKRGGYNTVQLMAIMEHPYYASFGYQVTSFFAASSWYGSPDELKELINAAHGMGISVLLDVVHSHAAPNELEGIAAFDGTDTQFFHAGERGWHPAWGTRLFDYGSHGVLHFLLSNLKFWLEEYHFDGFRFDGVTSMLYRDHGLGTSFDSYQKYFSENTDLDTVTYLQLASELCGQVKPRCRLIAEDMSAMPGMCLPIADGGVGFDYRLSMGVPDFWIKTIKEKRDEDWDMQAMWHELTTRRPMEKNVGYAESHDQALVGDKTIMFRLADKDMYWHMDKASRSLVIDRAMALEKLIKLATATLAGEGYLNFMGNEFGHPEWIDFPREGNGWSYAHARRLWSVGDAEYLRYSYLGAFDRALTALLNEEGILGSPYLRNLWTKQGDQLLCYEKNGLLFLLNWHPTRSYPAFFLPTNSAGGYRVLLDTDEARFGGEARVSHEVVYEAAQSESRAIGFSIYMPARTGVVLKSV